MKIGVMGGTFNPIHNGHLLIGEYARTELGLDYVIYIPNARPNHKTVAGDLSPRTRFEMVELAIRDNPFFQLSDMELSREGLSYTIDTIRELKKTYKDADIYFIIGDDSLFNLESWKDYKELLKACKFAVFRRGDRTQEEIQAQMLSLAQDHGASLSYIDSPLMEISSTEIRKRIRQKKTIKYQLPSQVEDYIHTRNLYGDD